MLVSNQRCYPIHACTICPLPEFLKLYLNISYFTKQGEEKYNDTATKHYFRFSNHRGISALKQILLKKNRIQLLEAAGMERIKKSYKCRNCEGLGHTIKTCSANFTKCQTAVCCAHPIKVDGRWTQMYIVNFSLLTLTLRARLPS